MLNLYFLLFFFTINIVQARILHMDVPRNYYSTYPDNNNEQASRDLDLTFAAGDDTGDNDQGIIYPTKKVYVSPERPIGDMGREIDHPVYYKMSEMPARKIIYYEPSSMWQRKPKYMRLNNPKGEIILELRVIANSNNNNNNY